MMSTLVCARREWASVNSINPIQKPQDPAVDRQGAVSTPRLLVFSSLYPNTQQPNAGVFVPRAHVAGGQTTPDRCCGTGSLVPIAGVDPRVSPALPPPAGPDGDSGWCGGIPPSLSSSARAPAAGWTDFPWRSAPGLPFGACGNALAQILLTVISRSPMVMLPVGLAGGSECLLP